MIIWLLILTHNRLEQVQQCFESLLPTLQRDDVRLRVLDNASSDGTAEYVREFVRSIEGLWNMSNENLGVALGRSMLLRDIAAWRKPDDLVVFLDSDTVIVDDNWLDVLAKAIEPENVGIVGCGGSFVLPDWSGFIAGVPGEVDCVAGYCTMMKAELFLQGLAMDTSFERFWSEDSDLNFQARAMGYDVICCPVGVQHFPAHSGFGQEPGLHEKNFSRLRDKWQGKGVVKCEKAY